MTKFCSAVVLALLFSALCPVLPAAAQLNYYNVDQNKKKPVPQESPAAAATANPDAGVADGDAAADDSDTSDTSDNADKGPKIYPAQSSVVTSVDACLDKLDPETAAELRRDYNSSYQECQARLADKVSAKKQVTVQKAKTPDAENARNFVRVRKPVAEPETTPGVAPADATGTWASTKAKAPATTGADSDAAGDAAPQTGSWHAADTPAKSTTKPVFNR